MSQNDYHDHVWEKKALLPGTFQYFMECKICNKCRHIFRSSYEIVFPYEDHPDGSRPYIEFRWRYGEKPKRYDLESLVEKLAELGILQEIKEN